jgi:hypothetical protein
MLFSVRTSWGHQYVQPNHLNATHAFLNTEQASVTALQNKSADRDQRWKILVLPMQKADSFRDESGGKVGAAKIADLNRPRKAILQCNGNGLPRKRPFSDQLDAYNTYGDHDDGSYDQAPARNG